MKRILVALVCAVAAGSATAQTTITIDPADHKQTMYGMGVDSAGMTVEDAYASDGTYLGTVGTTLSDARAEQFFSESAGIGIPWVRARLSANNGTTAHIAALLKMKAHGARFWGTCGWSSLEGWVDLEIIDEENDIRRYRLKPSKRADYVANCVAAMAHAASYGITIEYLDLFGEPDEAAGYYGTEPSEVFADGPEYRDLAILFGAALGDGKVMLPSTSTGSNMPSYTDPTLANTAARAALGVASTHGYSAMGSYANAGANGKPFWVTEWNEQSAPDDASMISALTVARRIHDSFASYGVSQFTFFLMEGWNPWIGHKYGLLGNDWSDTQRFWAFGNYSKFIRPGSWRVNVTGVPANVYVTAYEDEAHRLVIVAINTSIHAPASVSFAGTGKPAMVPWLTSPLASLSEQTPVLASGGAITYSLPVNSVVTFVAGLAVTGKEVTGDTAALAGSFDPGSLVTVTSTSGTVGTVTYPSSTTWAVEIDGLVEGVSTVTVASGADDVEVTVTGPAPALPFRRTSGEQQLPLRRSNGGVELPVRRNTQ